MTWKYSQSTGILTHNGYFIAKGYSGKGAGINNPSMQDVYMTGPIPQGHYRIDGYNKHKGPYTVKLVPILGTNTYGRGEFRIHGDRSDGSYHQASEGCIVINGATLRKSIASSSDDILVVAP